MAQWGGLLAGVLVFGYGPVWASDGATAYQTDGYRLVSSGLHSVRKTGFLSVPTTVTRAPALDISGGTSANSEPFLPVPMLRPRSRTTFIDLFGWEDDDRVTLATYRSNGPVYFKGRAGYMHFDGEPDYLSDLSMSDFVGNLGTSGALGLGAGYKLSNGERLEFEYTVNKLDQQVFSVGYTF